MFRLVNRYICVPEEWRCSRTTSCKQTISCTGINCYAKYNKNKSAAQDRKKNMVMFPGNCIYIFLLSSGFLSMFWGSIIAAWIIFSGAFFFNACRFSHEIHLNSIHVVHIMSYGVLKVFSVQGQLWTLYDLASIKKEYRFPRLQFRVTEGARG